MRIHRFITLLFAAATAAGLAFAPPAQAQDNIVKLVSSENGKCLQPINGSGDRGVAIVQQPCNGSTAQQWTVTAVSSTAVHLVNGSSHLCLDARGGATNGTPIQQWPCNKITNENWSFGITNNLLSSGVSGTFSHCVATPGDQNGLAMSLRFCTITPSMVWTRPPG
ncbi:MAG: RICIN domain-containing protein [Terracidiphilus sp.]